MNIGGIILVIFLILFLIYFLNNITVVVTDCSRSYYGCCPDGITKRTNNLGTNCPKKNL